MQESTPLAAAFGREALFEPRIDLLRQTVEIGFRRGGRMGR